MDSSLIKSFSKYEFVNFKIQMDYGYTQRLCIFKIYMIIFFSTCLKAHYPLQCKLPTHQDSNPNPNYPIKKPITCHIISNSCKSTLSKPSCEKTYCKNLEILMIAK